MKVRKNTNIYSYNTVMRKLITFTCFIIGLCLGTLIVSSFINSSFAQNASAQSIDLIVPGVAASVNIKLDYCEGFEFIFCHEPTDCPEEWGCAFPPEGTCTPSLCMCIDFQNGMGSVVCEGCADDQTLGVCLPIPE